MKEVTIHTDGACSGNPGPGGWAAVLQHDGVRKEISGGAKHTTNNRMELIAAVEALRRLKLPCKVRLVTDSKYLNRGMNEWVHKWQRNGWKTASKKPVENQELWQELIQLSETHEIEWAWTKGHAHDPNNQRCDRLARAEIKRITGSG